MPTEVRIENLPRLLRALKEYAPDVRKHFLKRARHAVEAAVAEARSNASWSTGASGHGAIPAAISAFVAARGVGIRVSKKKAPHGGIYERGNAGARGGSATFRHPVFGNKDVWVTQAVRTFLAPAMETKHEEVIVAMIQAVEETTRELELR